jgi:DNA repair protein RecN (Recombination protein N)
LLKNIRVQNFALIDHLDLSLESGLTMITGETGAGKSILLGALGLLQGARADLNAVRDSSVKCIIEAQFVMQGLHLEELFVSNDLDYEVVSILRREILPSGKSRAFINDTPVTLKVMTLIGGHLIDIHSQHQTLEISTLDFQLEVLDSFVDTKTKHLKRGITVVLDDYKSTLVEHQSLNQELKRLKNQEAQLNKELDYNTFLLNELEQVPLEQMDESKIQEELNQLSNVELISEVLSELDHGVNNEDTGIADQLRALKNSIHRIKNFAESYSATENRLTTILIELEDISTEVDGLKDQLTADPERMEQLSVQLNHLNLLFKKHKVDQVNQLIEIRDALADQILTSQGMGNKMNKLVAKIAESATQLLVLGNEIHELRAAFAPDLEKEAVTIIQQLGMPAAQFKIVLDKQEDFLEHGMDELKFIFSANKGGKLLELDKAASGGELSRLMLAIKSILSHCKQLPTIIFDEIDTGVSGHIAEKMAEVMKAMSKTLQVITITHLPQIAAAGNDHLVVRKKTVENTTVSNIERLSDKDRIEEIAQMLSGGKISDAARDNAKVLLN